MSQLSNKIESLTYQYGVELNQAYTLTPTITGTNAPGSSTLTLTGSAPTYTSSVGPLGGAGSWQWTQNAGQTATNVRTSTTTFPSTWADGDYSTGIWFMLDGIPVSTGTTSFHALFPQSSSAGFILGIRGTGNSNGGKLYSNITAAANGGFGPVINPGQWYYVAHRKSTTANTVQIYLDGTLVYSGSNTATAGSGSAYFGISTTSTASNTVKVNLSNFYVATYNDITSTQISEIWTAGSTTPATNINITETPATASALQTEPTLVVQAGDHTEVTTSILVSSEMVDPVSVIAEINFTQSETIIDVSATLEDTINISTGLDTSNAAAVLAASALIVEPSTSYAPMTASAQSGDHLAYVTPNYYSKVKALNPYAYIYNGKPTATVVNSGYQPLTVSVGSNVYTEQDGGLPLNIIGEGKSWYLRGTYNSPHQITMAAPSLETSFDNKIGSGNFSVEFWIKPDFEMSGQISGFDEHRLFLSNGLTINRHSKYYGAFDYRVDGISVEIKTNSSGSTQLLQGGYSKLDNTKWHHVVVQSALQSNGNLATQVFIDGESVITGTATFTPWTPSTNTTMVFGGTNIDTHARNLYLDEIALYDAALTNSTVIDHYQFINTASPNRTILAEPFTLTSEFLDASFVAISNVNYPQTSASSSALLVNPTVTPSRTIDILATPITASAIVNDVTVKRGWTVYPEPATSYAESVNAFRLNNIYSNYVQTNITPYRYVTFDGNNSYADYGTDADYSVAATVVGGTIVNPDLGINGKSALTTGTSYVTDGVILKESEWNDNWGTGLNNYHSSFWIQKSENDNSTGLRVVWNLNGHYNNQHVILYQYQNKLHLNFNNGSGTSINQATVANYDLFDGQRHFVAVAFDHTGSNNRVNLFVDAVDVMTVNLGSYTGTTVNGIVYVPANDEANNHPRLSIGCLITPFASTSLPVQPTNTRIIADEIIWAKSSLTQTLATNLFNVMPVKGEAEVLATPIVSSALIVEPLIIINSVLSVEYATAEIEIVEPEMSADREAVVVAEIAIANAYMEDAKRVNNLVVVSDVFMASASIGESGVKITIPGGPMLATASIPKNITPKSPVSLYMKYLISKTLVTQQMLREVK